MEDPSYRWQKKGRHGCENPVCNCEYFGRLDYQAFLPVSYDLEISAGTSVVTTSSRCFMTAKWVSPSSSCIGQRDSCSVVYRTICMGELVSFVPVLDVHLLLDVLKTEPRRMRHQICPPDESSGSMCERLKKMRNACSPPIDNSIPFFLWICQLNNVLACRFDSFGEGGIHYFLAHIGISKILSQIDSDIDQMDGEGLAVRCRPGPDACRQRHNLSACLPRVRAGEQANR